MSRHVSLTATVGRTIHHIHFDQKKDLTFCVATVRIWSLPGFRLLVGEEGRCAAGATVKKKKKKRNGTPRRWWRLSANLISTATPMLTASGDTNELKHQDENEKKKALHPPTVPQKLPVSCTLPSRRPSYFLLHDKVKNETNQKLVVQWAALLSDDSGQAWFFLKMLAQTLLFMQKASQTNEKKKKKKKQLLLCISFLLHAV